MPTPRKGKRILSLDGGGIRGMFLIDILRSLETACGRKITDLFDIVVGTSTGGLIAAGLLAGRSLDSIEECYWKCSVSFEAAKPSILTEVSRFMYGSIISPDVIYGIIQDMVGDIRLDELPESPRLLMVATDASQSLPRPFLFRNRPVDKSNFQYVTTAFLADAVRCSTSAPTYYPNHTKIGARTIVDGAIHSNNPVLFAIAEAALVFPDSPIDIIVSIGSGLQEVTLLDTPPSGFIEWVTSILNMSTDTETSHNLAAAIMGSKLIRINPPNVGRCYIWESDKEIIQSYKNIISSFCDVLSADIFKTLNVVL